MIRTLLLSLIASLGIAHAAPRLAVLELTRPQAMSAPTARYLSDLVRGALVKGADGWLVMTRENLRAHLPPGVELAACEGDCVVTTARNVGADAVVSGEIVDLKGDLRVLLKLHATADGVLLATARAGGTLTQIEAGVPTLVAPLVAALKTRPAPQVGPAAQRIDFSDAKDGDFPPGYGGLRVYAALRDMVLGAPREGTWSTTIPVRFAGDFALTVHMAGNTRGQAARCTRLTLDGAPPVQAQVCPHPDDRWTFGFVGSASTGSLRAAHDQIMPVRIVRAGATLRLILDDRLMASQPAPTTPFTGLTLQTRTGPPMRDGKVDGFALEAISLGAPR